LNKFGEDVLDIVEKVDNAERLHTRDLLDGCPIVD
jgi:hypothetical protein